MKKTKLTRSLMAACSIVALSAVMYGCVHSGDDEADMDTGGDTGGMEMPSSVSVTMAVALDAATQAALGTSLLAAGDSDTVEVGAGMSVTRSGVVFSCESAHSCTFTVSNNLGEIVASVTTRKAADAADPIVTAALPPPPPGPADTFAELNDGSTASIRALVTVTTVPDNNVTTPGREPTELTGMGFGGMGVNNADDAALRSSFDPNTAAATGTADSMGGMNGLMGGSTLGKDPAGDPADAISGGDIASAPAGWEMKTLFRDWGDTAGTGDGGFETGAIVVKNIGSPTPHPWDADLAGRFVNNFTLPGITLGNATNNPYHLTVRADGATVDADNPLDSVAFMADQAADNPGGMGSHVNANVAGAGALGITVTSADDGAFRVVSGQFLGVSGTYTCGETDCALSRESGTDNFNLGAGNWRFTPAAGATVRVPDQDWMAYGAWMTTPDNPVGPHRIGTFFNGFDVYAAGENFTAGDDGLNGSAKYNGGATGIYVDGDASGLFTATATLTANFDVDGTGDDGDYTISGSIHDFRGTDGQYLGDDTQADPNDPVAGGENDWVVVLAASGLGDLGTDSNTTGSADGLLWTGMWSGSLFGPTTMGEDEDGVAVAVAPSGVAGQFRASTLDPDGDGDLEAGNTAVVGAFGAGLGEHTLPDDGS